MPLAHQGNVAKSCAACKGQNAPTRGKLITIV